MAITTLRFDPGQVGSTNNVNKTSPNEAEIDIAKTFADITINGGVASIQVDIDDSELATNPGTGEENFLEKTQGDSNTTITAIRVVMGDGTVYTLKDGSPVDFREQDTSDPPNSLNPSHGDTFVETNSSVVLVDENGNDAPTTGSGSFANLTNQNLIFSSTGDWTSGTQTRQIDSSGSSADSTGDGLFNGGSMVICFARGTRILTPAGEIAIEDLEVGDHVHTMDHGPQPIRWISSSRVAARDNLAPIKISSGAMGNTGDLCVSPQHKMLVSGARAELYFGTSEVLVPAKMLVNDCSIRPVISGEVEYFHMLFDEHEIVWAEGIPTESFHPGEQALDTLQSAEAEEIFQIFPELRSDADQYGPSARLVLKSFEASVCLAAI
jgi:hypothetical protein